MKKQIALEDKDGSKVYVGDLYKDEENFLWEVMLENGEPILENVHIPGQMGIEEIKHLEDTGINIYRDK